MGKTDMRDLLIYCCRCGRKRVDGTCDCHFHNPSAPRYCAMCGRQRTEGDGSSTMVCRPCDAAYKHVYRERNVAYTEKSRIMSREWARNNPERVAVKRTKAHAAESEQRRVARAAWLEEIHARQCHTLAESATLIGIAYSTLMRQLSNGAIVAAERVGHRPLIHRSEIERYICENKGTYGLNNPRYRATIARRRAMPVVIVPPEPERIHPGWLAVAS